MRTRVTLIPAAGFVALAVLGATPASAQSGTLNLPFRGGGATQTAATTIEFDASNIAAGAAISVAGVSVPVPASPCAGAACIGADSTPTGDDIQVIRISGTNRAQLVVTFFGSFTGANLCAAPTIGPTGRTFTIALSGFTFGGATNGYRITSYFGASDATCNFPYARVPSARPTLTGTGLTRLGRLPLNLVLVLDKSPSMAWTIPGSADIRWDRLKASVLQFVGAWDVIGAPPPPLTVSSEGHAEDKLGVVFFGGSAVESPLDGVNFFKTRGASASPWLAPVTTALGPSPPSFIGGTSVGAGTVNGRSRLDTVDQVIGDTAILLFTDGEQNTAPCILRNGETAAPISRPYPGMPPGTTYLDSCHVAAAQPEANLLTMNGSGTPIAQSAPRGPIFTIGLGEGGMADSARLLDEIAQETAGRSRFPHDGIALDTSFADSLVEHLKGGTVSLLNRVRGSVAAGTAATAPLAVEIDPSLTRAMFVFGWDGSARELLLEIRRPDGTTVTAPLTASTPNSRIAAVNLPSDGPSGAWQVRVVRQSGVQTALNYHLSAYGVESKLGARVTETRRLGTGSPIQIVAEVGWSDAGLDNLPGGAIRATIERPGQNLGTILHNTVIPTPTPVRNDTSPLAMKMDQLARTANMLKLIEPQPAQTITLQHVGFGRYEGTFNGANVGGDYRIRVNFDWDDARTTKIQRLYFAERQVLVIPSPTTSVVSVNRDGDKAVISITPRDRFGNYVGPGFESQFKVDVAGTVMTVADPDVTGVYTINLTGLTPGADPKVHIEYDGVVIRDSPVSQLPTAGGGKHAVWFAFGRTIPHGTFSNGFDGGAALTGAYEHGLGGPLALEFSVGRHQFKGKGTPDLDVTHIGANAKLYLTGSGNARPFLTAGGGAYVFDPGSTRAGVNIGAGSQFVISPVVSIEGRYALHLVFDNAPNSRYSTLQAAVRFSF